MGRIGDDLSLELSTCTILTNDCDSPSWITPPLADRYEESKGQLRMNVLVRST